LEGESLRKICKGGSYMPRVIFCKVSGMGERGRRERERERERE